MTKTLITALLGAAALVAGCASTPSPAELDQLTQQVMKASFRDEGIAKTSRLNQDLGQQACSSDKAPSEAVTKQIESEALASIQWPAGGRYIGDWREGEKLAQSGRGMTWTDASAEPKANGANCYNCHQIDKKEISYGTIGRGRPGDRGRRAVHLGQAVEQQGLRGLLEHAALRPHEAARRRATAPRDGAAARPEVARQPVSPKSPRLRAF
jgi:outer membrane murein-binding lipoprotein Lpp